MLAVLGIIATILILIGLGGSEHVRGMGTFVCQNCCSRAGRA